MVVNAWSNSEEVEMSRISEESLCPNSLLLTGDFEETVSDGVTTVLVAVSIDATYRGEVIWLNNDDETDTSSTLAAVEVASSDAILIVDTNGK
jgi:hypothetical protein